MTTSCSDSFDQVSCLLEKSYDFLSTQKFGSSFIFFLFLPYHLKLKSHRVKGLSNMRACDTRALLHSKPLALSTNFGESISDQQDEHIPNSWG